MQPSIKCRPFFDRLRGCSHCWEPGHLLQLQLIKAIARLGFWLGGRRCQNGSAREASSSWTQRGDLIDGLFALDLGNVPGNGTMNAWMTSLFPLQLMERSAAGNGSSPSAILPPGTVFTRYLSKPIVRSIIIIITTTGNLAFIRWRGVWLDRIQSTG
jgi:hypothetical protein